MAPTSGQPTTSAVGVEKGFLGVNFTDSKTPDTIIAQTVHFEDLPAEIRNEIYKHALTLQFPIKVSRCNAAAHRSRAKFDSFGPRASRTPKYRLKATTIMLKGKQKRRVPLGRVVDLPLLRTSKLVNIEATSILLSNNCFILETGPATKAFIDALGHHAVSLSDVEVIYRGWWFSETNRRQIESVAVMANPKRIAIVADREQSRHHTAQFIRDLISTIVMRKVVKKESSGELVCGAVSSDEQLQRFQAFQFNVFAGSRSSFSRGKAADTFDAEERRTKLTAEVLKHWQQQGEDKVKAGEKEARVSRPAGSLSLIVEVTVSGSAPARRNAIEGGT